MRLVRTGAPPPPAAASSSPSPEAGAPNAELPPPAPTHVCPADGLLAFQELSAAQQELLGADGDVLYDSLDLKRKTGFLLITTELAHAGISTRGLRLKDGTAGIHQDRLLFAPDPEALEALRAEVREACRKGGFQKSRLNGGHKGMKKDCFRQTRFRNSLQIGTGPAGGFVDIDRFNPLSGLWGMLGHLLEMIVPGKTDPIHTRQSLRHDFRSRLPPGPLQLSPPDAQPAAPSDTFASGS